jgi:peptidoglycan biosynthesis protein MviN/MurJ (putative lipid II flippase)
LFPLARVGVGEWRFGAAGLALGASAGAWLEYVLLRRALGLRLGPHGPRGTHLARLIGAAALAAGMALAARALFETPLRAVATDALDGPLVAAGTAGTFGVTYLAAASLFGVGRGLRRLLRR